MSTIGHGIAYATGAIDLPSLLGTYFGDTQFKQLTIAAAFGVVSTCAITSWAVTERVLVDPRDESRKGGGKFKVIGQIWYTILHLPPRIRAICMAQFWSWIGWFPFLFYSTTWVSRSRPCRATCLISLHFFLQSRSNFCHQFTPRQTPTKYSGYMLILWYR